ncbi:concanavalin A-like lectin protein kinase family protein [Artemisia annua]|uniref:non-specific serine/threonine protein kinase n=1 Tax=Artemisia annua TaxID=35608 RepID=A0A2U1P4C9_ARTAN|nr:concanavalin A-like lectin protein kinase family protein [Artemisia annua]
MGFSIAHHITYILLVFIPYAASITFNMTNIGPQNPDIVITGSRANLSVDGIELTPITNNTNLSKNTGRATYIRSLHLYDSRSRGLASFSTSFTFVIDSNQNTSYGDGLTFFLAQNNSVLTAGGAMGLPLNDTPEPAASRFVAVEFDTFWNNWDPVIGRNTPMGDHVGIDVSSLSSARAQKWLSNVTGGGVCQAWVTYDSVSKNLSVSFTGFQNNTVVRQDGLFYTVDLRDVLPEWVVFGFSAATGNVFQRNTVRSWTFNSSDLVIDGNELQPPIPSPDFFIPVPDSVNGKNNKVGLIIGVSAAITFLVLIAFVLWRRKKMTSEDEVGEQTEFDVEMNNKFETGIGPKQFSYHELAQSSSDFAENKKLGEGGFGRVYRYKIANGLASALLYLHEEWEQCVLHRDIKSSNVMLDSNFNAKLGDFGLAKLVDHEKGMHTMTLAGTLGYLAPECVVTGKASKESDVFSFGVVALEIACGRKPIEYKAREKQIQLLEWVWELYGNGALLEAVDPRLGSDFEEEEIKRLMIVGLWCVHPDSELRPSMRKAIQVLNFEDSLPILPSTMPVASSLAPHILSLFGVASKIQKRLSSSVISID